MKGQWILVLLCLTFVGELVFGSLFPPQNNPGSSPDNVNPAGTEEVWLSKPIAMTQEHSEIHTGEIRVDTRGIHLAQEQEKNLKIVHITDEMPPKIIVTSPERKAAVSDIVAKSNAEVETKS